MGNAAKLGYIDLSTTAENVGCRDQIGISPVFTFTPTFPATALRSLWCPHPYRFPAVGGYLLNDIIQWKGKI
jgi:hypothetical protein